jgi:hypothetical protein
VNTKHHIQSSSYIDLLSRWLCLHLCPDVVQIALLLQVIGQSSKTILIGQNVQNPTTNTNRSQFRPRQNRLTFVLRVDFCLNIFKNHAKENPEMCELSGGKNPPPIQTSVYFVED